VEADALVLIDTSVWIDVWGSSVSRSAPQHLRDLVVSGRAATCEIVIAEVLRGADSAAEAAELDADLRALQVLSMEGVGTLAAAMGREMNAPRRLFGDLLIAATARAHGCAVLHNDDDLAGIAHRFGIEDLRR
jgi:predicted nucleic acid-binding protein